MGWSDLSGNWFGLGMGMHRFEGGNMDGWSKGMARMDFEMKIDRFVKNKGDKRIPWEVTSSIGDRETYFELNKPLGGMSYDDVCVCMCCGEKIRAKDYKVVRCFDGPLKEDYICCPNWPRCKGTALGWIDVDEASSVIEIFKER